MTDPIAGVKLVPELKAELHRKKDLEQGSVIILDFKTTETIIAALTAADEIAKDAEQARTILAGTAIGSLPNDYPLSKLALDVWNTLQERTLEGLALVGKLEAAGEMAGRPMTGILATLTDDQKKRALERFEGDEIIGPAAPASPVEDVVEKVARALYRYHARNTQDAGNREHEDYYWKVHSDVARAVLAAIGRT